MKTLTPTGASDGKPQLTWASTPPDMLRLWSETMRADGQSEHTIRRRVGTLNRIEREFGKPAEHLDVDEIIPWLSRFPSQSTKASYYGDLEAFYAWRLLRGEMTHAPTNRMKPPRQPKHLPNPVSTGEFYRGLDTATGNLRIWIMLGGYQGLRVSEAAAVSTDHIGGDPGFRLITIHGKGGSEKTLPLAPELETVMDHMPERGWWFPGRFVGHVTAHTVAERVTDHFTAAGVRGFTFHRLRHWCGTEMLRAGASLREVQEFLRHDDIGTTTRYTQVLHDDLRQAAARLPRRAQIA